MRWADAHTWSAAVPSSSILEVTPRAVAVTAAAFTCDAQK